VTQRADEHYEKIASQYDDTWAHRPEYLSWMSDHCARRLDMVPGGQVADVGHLPAWDHVQPPGAVVAHPGQVFRAVRPGVVVLAGDLLVVLVRALGHCRQPPRGPLFGRQ